MSFHEGTEYGEKNGYGKDKPKPMTQDNTEQTAIDKPIDEIVKDLLQEHPSKVDEYHNGQVGLLGLFVGEAMKKCHGRSDPKTLTGIIKGLLDMSGDTELKNKFSPLVETLKEDTYYERLTYTHDEELKVSNIEKCVSIVHDYAAIAVKERDEAINNIYQTFEAHFGYDKYSDIEIVNAKILKLFSDSATQSKQIEELKREVAAERVRTKALVGAAAVVTREYAQILKIFNYERSLKGEDEMDYQSLHELFEALTAHASQGRKEGE